MAQDFDGRVALVVGGSRGIGAAVARAFAAAGARVGLAARSTEALESVVAGIRRDGGEAIAIPADGADPAGARDIVDRVVRVYGRLDVAVNNTAFNPRPGFLTEIDDDDFVRSIAANLLAVQFGMKHQIPAMIRTAGGGSIVTMSSGAGVRPRSHLGPYVAGKAASAALSQVAALEYADQGVRVNVLAPGPIRTEHLERAGTEAQEMAAQAVPMGRIGTVDDVAAAVLWLCSDDAAFVTGAVLPLDGGQLAGERLRMVYDQGRGMRSGG